MFHEGDAVSFSNLSDGLWFLSQSLRWGWLATDYGKPGRVWQVADVHFNISYREAAASVAIQMLATENRRNVPCDGIARDGPAAQAYADTLLIP